MIECRDGHASKEKTRGIFDTRFFNPESDLTFFSSAAHVQTPKGSGIDIAINTRKWKELRTLEKGRGWKRACTLNVADGQWASNRESQKMGKNKKSHERPPPPLKLLFKSIIFVIKSTKIKAIFWQEKL